MSPKRRLFFLGSVCLLSITYAASVSTPDTMVVSRVDDATEAPLDGSSSSSDPVTEEPAKPIKMTKMDVKSVISLRYAHTSVVAYVRNPAHKAQEANFRVLLPDTAFISGFVMTLDGKSYKAYVKEKKEAAEIYQNAVSQGIGAAHVAAKARDSNHFTVTANVEGMSTAIFNLTYEELLQYRNSVYNQEVNLQPGGLVPDFTVTIEIRESNNIIELRVPEIRTGNEIDATKDDPQISNAVITKDGATATVVFKPDLAEQERLMSVYAEKSKDSSHGNVEGVLGQFVVQYDVERPQSGEILVNGGYFVHFYAPKDEYPLLSKHVVFVLDTSGSMFGRKIEQLKQAMHIILSELNPRDYFSIVSFDYDVLVTDILDADKEPPKRTYEYYNRPAGNTTLQPPSKATPENINRAKIIVDRFEANGGTNIDSALNVALDLISSRSNLLENSTSTAKEEISASEPIIIFLTDGEATVGETNTKTIITHVAENNYGVNKATIFSLDLGDDADRKFLRKLSLRNNGFARHIYEASDTALQLRDFYRQVSSPLLTHVKFTYPPEQVVESSVTKSKFRTYYAGSELVVSGRVQDAALHLNSQVEAFCGVEDEPTRTKKFKKTVKVPVAVEKSDLPLERLWAYLTIKQLLDQSDASDSTAEEKKKESSPEQQALKLALKYEFVTPLTSLVVVKPNASDAVNAESVDGDGERYQALSQSALYGGPVGAPGLPAPLFNYVSRPAASHLGSFSSANLMPISAFANRPSGQALFASDLSYVESEDAADYDQFASYPTTPAPAPTTPRLCKYNLEKYAWIEPYMNSAKDSITFQESNSTITLKLVTSEEVPKSESRCTKGGIDTWCVYLTRCRSAQNFTIEDYKSIYCDVNGYAGVCCPRSSIDAC